MGGNVGPGYFGDPRVVLKVPLGCFETDMGIGDALWRHWGTYHDVAFVVSKGCLVSVKFIQAEITWKVLSKKTSIYLLHFLCTASRR